MAYRQQSLVTGTSMPGVPWTRPFSAERYNDLDFDLRRDLARLTTMQETVLRLRHGIGTGRRRSLEEVASLLGLGRNEVAMVERAAVKRFPPTALDAWQRRMKVAA